MIQTRLDLLADLGATTLDPLWLPILAWTAFALPLLALLNRTDRLHPNAEYRLSQVLLAALPLGIAAVSVVEMLPEATRSTLLPAQSVVVPPAIETTSVGTPTVSWSWMHTVGLLTIGVLAIGLFQIARLLLDLIAVGRAQWRLATTSTPSLQAKTQRLAAQLNVRRPVQPCVTSDAPVPLTLGGLRPTIVVPDRLLDAPEALEMSLRHELVHIRRWDDLAHAAERLVAALFAAHPLVGRLSHRIARTRERACDAAVLADGQTRAAPYARLLTAFAEGTPPSHLGALTLSESPSSLIDRLSAMRSSMPSLLSSRFTLGPVLVVAGLALTFGVVGCSDSIGPMPTTQDEESTTPKSTTASNSDGPVYMVLQNQPDLVGGMKALQNAVSYPEMAKEAGIEGRVIVQFVVDKTGDVVNPKVTRGVHKLLNQAALKAVQEITFKPGMKEGKPVKVKMSLPVTFRLPDASEKTSDATSDTSPADLQVDAPTSGLTALHIPSGVSPPDRQTRRRLHRRVPYPELAQKAGMEGRVQVRFMVDKTGRATDTRVVNSAPDLLAKAARRTVESVSFTPADLRGETIGVTFQFALPNVD